MWWKVINLRTSNVIVCLLFYLLIWLAGTWYPVMAIWCMESLTDFNSSSMESRASWSSQRYRSSVQCFKSSWTRTGTQHDMSVDLTLSNLVCLDVCPLKWLYAHVNHCQPVCDSANWINVSNLLLSISLCAFSNCACPQKSFLFVCISVSVEITLSLCASVILSMRQFRQKQLLYGRLVHMRYYCY